jgi:hypothetical protein
VNVLLFTDVEFDSPEAWENFQLIHGMAHQRVYDLLLEQNTVPMFLPLFDFPRNGNQDYLLDHWQVHRSNALLLNITSVPDLATYDLTDQGQYEDFLSLHAQVHQIENDALGI